MRALFEFFLLVSPLLFGACSGQEDGTLVPVDEAWEALDGCGRREYTDIASLPALYAANETPPVVPLRLGTPENMQQGLPFDFSGIWWMRGNEFPEILNTFAGLTCPDITPDWPNDPDFEEEYLRCRIPYNGKHQWSFDTSLPIRAYMLFNVFARDIPGSLSVRFYNETYGEIPSGIENTPFIWGDGWTIEKINENEWLRASYFQDRSIFDDTNYTLTRIFRADGTPTKFFSEYVYWMEEERSLKYNSLWVWDSDSACKRLCTAFSSCSFCEFWCGSK